jgi:hypothetical protein
MESDHAETPKYFLTTLLEAGWDYIGVATVQNSASQEHLRPELIQRFSVDATELVELSSLFPPADSLGFFYDSCENGRPITPLIDRVSLRNSASGVHHGT